MSQEDPTFMYFVFQHVSVVLSSRMTKDSFYRVFSAQVKNSSNEMTLVANESITMYYVLSLVVNGSGLKLMQFKMVSSRNIFLQAVLHGICCKLSSTCGA